MRHFLVSSFLSFLRKLGFALASVTTKGETNLNICCEKIHITIQNFTCACVRKKRILQETNLTNSFLPVHVVMKDKKSKTVSSLHSLKEIWVD